MLRAKDISKKNNNNKKLKQNLTGTQHQWKSIKNILSDIWRRYQSCLRHHSPVWSLESQILKEKKRKISLATTKLFKTCKLLWVSVNDSLHHKWNDQTSLSLSNACRSWTKWVVYNEWEKSCHALLFFKF